MRALAAVVLSLLLVACDGDGDPDVGPPTADAGPGLDAGFDAGEVTLEANAGEDRYADVGAEVVLDASASVGATSYEWDFGDGRGWDAPRPDPVARVTYDEPGLYRAFLAVFDDAGRRRVDTVSIRVTHPPVHTPRQSGSIAIWPERDEVAVVSPDSDQLVIFSTAADDFSLVRRVDVADDPRTVTVFDDRWAVTCQGGGAVDLVDVMGDVSRVDLGASRPFGAVATDGALFVTLQATGELARIEPDGSGYMLIATYAALDDARGVAVLPDGRLAVTRWRSPDDAAQILAMDTDGTGAETWTLAFDPRPSSDTETGGVPSYLDQLLVSPTGRLAIAPSLQAAIGEGLFNSPRPLTHETTVRAAISFLDPSTGEEDFTRRKLFDDRGFASAGAFSSRGDLFYVAMRGSRTVERRDLLAVSQAGTIQNIGFAVQGLALSADDRLLFVDAYLSRELVIYDVLDPGALPVEVARLPIVGTEPLAADVLLGKQLFNDAADARLGRDSYMACGHCHLDGLGDRRVWDFTDRGEGLRNTIDLVGRAGLADGPLHWSANFDEVHDFENDIRGPFRGTGLMDDADFMATSDTLGATKAGRSSDLDALAAYVTSLDTHLPSPFRNPDGSLSAAATRGRASFTSASCDGCHAGPNLTDSGFVSPGVPRLHDVGTLGAGSGMRLGGPLAGIDTPTLHGVWDTPPYLHDGSAATLRDVLTTRNPSDQHGTTSTLSAAEIDDLVAYLLSLDGRAD